MPRLIPERLSLSLRRFGGRVVSRALPWAPAGCLVFSVCCLLWFSACESKGGTDDVQASTSSTTVQETTSGDIEAYVGEDIEAGTAVITVRALEPTFQPALPEQRLSEEAPTAPGAGNSFYQAYVRVLNTAVTPIRVDPRHFYCLIGSTMATVEPTWSGPLPRSLLRDASLDLVLTFEGPLGYQPVLVYSPPWYAGLITVRLQKPQETTPEETTATD